MVCAQPSFAHHFVERRTPVSQEARGFGVSWGNNPQAIMEQTGHTDPSFTLRVYTHGMRRDQASKDRLHQLVGATVEAQADGSGTNGQFDGSLLPDTTTSHRSEMAG